VAFFTNQTTSFSTKQWFIHCGGILRSLVECNTDIIIAGEKDITRPRYTPSKPFYIAIKPINKDY
jgi:hypothetical protein